MAEPIVQQTRTRRLELLDLLRFFAALMVVVFHWFFNGINNGKVTSIEFTAVAPFAVYGFFGVHLFFLISGFVISQSANGKSAGQFFVSRGVRLFPAYWAAMIATTIVVSVWGNAAMKVTPLQFLANVTMVPNLFGQPFIDGVYWTLVIELSFYALVFLVLLLGLGRFLDRLFPIWGVLMLAVAVLLPSLSTLPYLGGYYAFFASGAIMATIQRSGFSAMRLIGLAAAGATALLFVFRQLPEFNYAHAFRASTTIVLALILLFFVAIALLWIPRVARLRIPFSRPVSDLTYPIYLLHAHIGYTVLNQVASQADAGLVYAAMFVGLFVAAWLLHQVIEVRMKATWYRGFGLLRQPIDRLQGLLSGPRRPTPGRRA